MAATGWERPAPTPPREPAFDDADDDAVTAAAAAVRAALGEPGVPAMTLWASMPGGCEPEAATELAALGWQPAAVTVSRDDRAGTTAGLRWERGAVYGACDAAGLEATLRAARTVTRVSWLLASTEVDSLADVAAVVRAAPPALPDAPFAVVAERHGEHPFTSLDVARHAGDAVIAAHRARTGRRLPVDLEDPVSVVRVEVTHRRLRAGCELTAGSRHRRSDLPRRHRAGLNPVIAAALLSMAGWRPPAALLDPMCGAGTILVEAARAARGLPPPTATGDRLDALGLRDRRAAARAEEAVASVAAQRRGSPLRISGTDVRPEHVADAQANLEAAGVADAVRVDTGDARHLDAAGDADVDVAVVNPPYGLRLGRSGEMEALYTQCLAALAARLRPGGRVVWLTPSHRVALRAAAAAGLESRGRRPIGLGAFDASACGFARP